MPVLTLRQDGRETKIEFEGTPRLDELLMGRGAGLPHPCGGRGLCKKCAVKAQGRLAPLTRAEKLAGTRLSCQTVLLGDCTVTLPPSTGAEQIETQGPSISLSPGGRTALAGQYGAAVDIGTTTMALTVHALDGGTCAAQAACLNPQVQISSDVMGRIGAAMQGKGPLLRRQVVQALESLLHRACRDGGLCEKQVSSLVVTGNTAMLYLLTGRDTAPLSRAPFQADTLFDATIPLLGREAYLPPCMDAFVGADITCAVMASDMLACQETALLVDIGTNGEIVLAHEGALYAASTAAGPAFEGAGISCGCGAIPGAIDRVWVEKGRICAHTIGERPAVGLCGSGLIDAIAAMRRTGMIDETGAMAEKQAVLLPGVALTPGDVRNVQLAKGAIAAGICTMLDAAGTRPSQIQRLYIAGGFGRHLDLSNAVSIGLFPKALASKAQAIGNAALSGAQLLLLDGHRKREARAIASRAKTVILGGNQVFANYYMEAMLFPE